VVFSKHTLPQVAHAFPSLLKNGQSPGLNPIMHFPKLLPKHLQVIFNAKYSTYPTPTFPRPKNWIFTGLPRITGHFPLLSPSTAEFSWGVINATYN
jgi:hypothetical protein